MFLALIFATCSALVRESDIIWFPVDDVEGVFVSDYGEKYRTNWNSRKTRFSPLGNSARISKQRKQFDEYLDESSYDSPRMAKHINKYEDLDEENFYDSPRMAKLMKKFEGLSEENFYDRPRKSKEIKKTEELSENNSYDSKSRLNDIPTRRPLKFSKNRRRIRQPSISDFQNEQSDNTVPILSRYRFYQKKQLNERPTKFIEIPKFQFKRRPNKNQNQDAIIQEAISEIFNVNRPETDENFDSQWDQNRPIRPIIESSTGQWNQNRPKETSSEWSVNPWPTGPNSPAQFPQSPPPSPPVQESIYEQRPTIDSDKVIFPDDNDEEEDSGLRVTTTESPNKPQITTPNCERSCQVTPEFNPVCGSDFVNYSNIGRLKCAQMCGKSKYLLSLIR